MASQFTIQQTINLGKMSISLSGNYKANGALFGATLQQSNPLQIAITTQALDWQYSGNPTDSTLRGVADYLYWLCGRFQLESQFIISGGGGGSILPPPSFITPSPLEFEVTGSTPIITGGNSVLLDGTSGNPDFRKYNLVVARGNQPQAMINDGLNSYYSWNKGTGLFQIFPNATAGELISITPVA